MDPGRRHYRISDRQQRRWDARNLGNLAIRAELVDAVFALAAHQLRAAEQILDLGCGTGWWLERLSADQSIGAKLHGLDALPERLSAARRRVPTASFTVGDVSVLPYARGSMDVICLFTVLSSLPGRDEIRGALSEARRILAPSGVVLIWEPRMPNPLNRRTVLVSRGELVEAFPHAAINVITTTVVPALARRLGPLTDPLYPRLVRFGALRTHRLMAFEPSAATVSSPPTPQHLRRSGSHLR